MKKDKLTCGINLLNVVNSLLHHITCAKIVKNAWTIFVQHLIEDMLATYYNYIKSFAILKWRK
jgi:hypothetical protein